jgi:hypothetical protein
MKTGLLHLIVVEVVRRLTVMVADVVVALVLWVGSPS